MCKKQTGSPPSPVEPNHKETRSPGGFFYVPVNEQTALATSGYKKARSMAGLKNFSKLKRLVLFFVYQSIAFDPWHHATQALTDLFDLMAVIHTACAFEASGT